MRIIKRLVVIWFFSRVPVPLPDKWIPRVFGWAIGAKSMRKVTRDELCK